VEQVETKLASARLPANRLELVITEKSSLQNDLEVLESLRL
jgi:hypothetical protein